MCEGTECTVHILCLYGDTVHSVRCVRVSHGGALYVDAPLCQTAQCVCVCMTYLTGREGRIDRPVGGVGAHGEFAPFKQREGLQPMQAM